jgi:hypothetical protein
MGSHQHAKLNLVDEQEIFHFGQIKVYQDYHGNQFFTQDYTFIVDQHAET